MLLRGQAVLVQNFHRLQKVTVNSQAATRVCRVHLREAEESGCGGSTRCGSNFIDGMLKYYHLSH